MQRLSLSFLTLTPERKHGENSYRNLKENRELGEVVCWKVINAVRLILTLGVLFPDRDCNQQDFQFDADYD